MWRITGVKPKELDNLVSLPYSYYYVWKAFIELDGSRSSNGFGVNPIPYSEIYSYSKLNNIEFDEWELIALKKFDSVVLKMYADRAEKERNKKP